MEKKYDKRHGGPYDRGTADAWYGRDKSPHYYTGATRGYVGSFPGPDDPTSKCITDLTPAELEAYNAGYDDSVRDGIHNQKDWGEF